jgi:hypothetical protein
MGQGAVHTVVAMEDGEFTYLLLESSLRECVHLTIVGSLYVLIFDISEELGKHQSFLFPTFYADRTEFGFTIDPINDNTRVTQN